MKRKGTIKKGIAWLMTAVMVFSITPVMAEPIQVQAEESQEVTTASTTKTIAGLGTSVIADPTDPGDDTTKAWTGSYVYYGNYDADGDGTAEPVKYRVLDASTTDYSADGTTNTMLLDCDSILYYTPFDGQSPYSNVWKDSPIYKSLNGDGFLHKDGVFTTVEKNAIAASTVDTHTLTTDNVADSTQSAFVNYVALNGEQIFLLDAEDVSNGVYGYSMTAGDTENRKKTGSSAAWWWLRSAYDSYVSFAGFVDDAGNFNCGSVYHDSPGVSPALNLNLSSVIFSSVISGTAGETGAEYKLTLLDDGMTIGANGDATRYGKTVTIPYHISGNNSSDATQVSVLILDEKYTAGNTNGATVLDYQKLKVDSFSASGTGTYTLPDSLYRKGCGTDYHMYILAEDVNGEKETDYASTPVEIIPTLTVNKKEVAPNKPESIMNTVYTNDTVGKVTLPEGWVWQDADKNTALTVGSPVTATAVYDGADKGNYVIESVEMSITRLACTHATTEIRDAVAATCTEKGYTGDTYCKVCGVKLASGTEIEMTAHKWDAGKITKEATETAEGEKTYTCSVCGTTKTEVIPKKTATTLQPPKKGAVVADDKGTGDYKVTDVTKKEVTYQTPANKKLATISVPATVKIGGVTYKVTAIADSAFVNNKKITKVTIGSNITTIGKKAFYKCTSLTKITIPSKVKKIGKQAFYGCKKLKNITIKTTKLTSKNVGSKAFKGIYAKAIIKVPKSKLKSYKKLLKARGVGKKAKIKK